MSKFYAGIGSRETPRDIQLQMYNLAETLYSQVIWLRSGHCKGADWAFERGAKDRAEIFLPWAGYERDNLVSGRSYAVTPDAIEHAIKFHPRGEYLSQGAKRLHGRNSQIVLGWNLDDPVDFVVCWTPNGAGTGGTGQALRIAEAMKIPVYNLFFSNASENLANDLREGRYER